jgi:flagellar motility protein MotE (MotC chaperone)
MAQKAMSIGKIDPIRRPAHSEDQGVPDFDFDDQLRKEPSFLRRVVVKIRLLPMVIFFCTLTLTVRVGDIWDGFDSFFNGTVSVSSTEAIAQTAAQTPPTDASVPAPGAVPSELEVNGQPDGGAADTGGGTSGGSGGGMSEEDRAAVAARMLADDPTLLTQSEIDLLQKLAERRVEIDSRGRELETREALLAAAESRIDQKISDFKALQATIESLIKTYDDQQDAKLMSLVKIYESMKPKDAALIFEELEMDVLLQVAERMKERSLAPIMAKMNPVRAREVTVELNALRKLPEPGAVGG